MLRFEGFGPRASRETAEGIQDIGAAPVAGLSGGHMSRLTPKNRTSGEGAAGKLDSNPEIAVDPRGAFP